MTQNNYYLGLDIGTNSVGWAVTDPAYVLKKVKGNLMWGVNLFDEAGHAAERRANRTARRRLRRRKQRIELLRELLAPEINKADPHFFDRLRESALFPEDSEHRTRFVYFDDKNYTDRDYFRDYPTIHHLISELMESDKPHDIRLVYLACAYLLKHRGHFLFEVDEDKIDEVRDFHTPYERFRAWFGDEIDPPFEEKEDTLAAILKQKLNITAKTKEIKDRLFGGKTPIQDKDPDFPIHVTKLIHLICGGTVKFSELFKNEAYKDLEKNSVCVASAKFDEEFEPILPQLEEGDGDLVLAVKGLYDWSLLEDILGGYGSISEAKKAVYEEHKADLKDMKKAIQSLGTKEYAEVFRKSDKTNYAAYVRVFSSEKNANEKNVKPCTQEGFCKWIAPHYLEKVDPDRVGVETLDRLKKKAKEGKLCPKQVTGDNRVIPYQLFYDELKKLLERAKKYLPILNKSDEYGSVADKILSIMCFRVPYYVGPLAQIGGKKSHAWIERKADGKIYPWNFEDIVDLDKSEDEFIRRLTGKCTYLAGEDVLPKNSLLYTKFCVLNEINCISVDRRRISTEVKQKIYRDLFLNKSGKVTKKKIRDFLIAEGEMTAEQSLSGIDDSLKSSLKPHRDFRRLLSDRVLTESEAEAIIERITATTDKSRLKKWLKANFERLTQDDVNYIARLSYKDYGRLSRAFLEEIEDIDPETGEVTGNTVISTLWENSLNLMELLSDQFGFRKIADQWCEGYYGKARRTVSERLEEMYVPAAARRPIIRALEIAKEVKHIMGCDPKKIFVEMPRETADNGKKGKRTKSRKELIPELLETAREIVSSDEIEHLKSTLDSLDEGALRSDKYYLYFTQLGKCMYSGDPIELSEIEKENVYNIDHIYPRSKVKDDSISNKVLVKSQLNGEKGDGSVKPEVIRKMRPFWENLRKKGLISEKKLERLTRSKPFTEDELAGFINRQLVETTQSSKGAAVLLKELFKDSEIVYVKAQNVSDFRKLSGLLKCREINDLHHAKDAYLNIAVGNVYDVRFTRDPARFIGQGERYSLKPEVIFSDEREIVRGGVTAWRKDSMETIKRMMGKNSVRYVKYSYTGKGQLFAEQPVKAKSKEEMIPIKKGLSTEKYGGYWKASLAYYSLMKCGKTRVLIPVEIWRQADFESGLEEARRYAYEKLKNILGKTEYRKLRPEEIEFPLGARKIKIGSMLEVDGFRVTIRGKDTGGKYITVSTAVSLVTDSAVSDYVKRLSRYAEQSENGKKFKAEHYARSSGLSLSSEQNLELYDLIADKCLKPPFSSWKQIRDRGEKLRQKREEFTSLDLTQQSLALLEIVRILKTNRTGGVDLTEIGESKSACVLKLGAVLSAQSAKEVYLIDQSPTGLLEKRSPNLMEL